MAKYKITAPDGNSYEVTAPDNASQEQVLGYAKENYSKVGGSPGKSALASYMSFMGKEGGYGSNPSGKLMSMFQKPFNVAGEKIAEFGGKKGYPKTGAAIGTVVEMAPDIGLSAISPPEGNVEPGKIAKGFFKQLESASGGMKGSLEEQFKTPTLMFSKGTGSAKPLYQEAMKELPYEQTIFKGLTKHGEIVDKAVETIEAGGKLKPQESLIARKSLDKVKKTLSDDAFNYYRRELDSVAKSNVDIRTADPLHRRGMMAESLRNLMPQNKYGGASAFKMGIVPALSGIGGAIAGPMGATMGGAVGAAALSPAVQGGIVGAAGLAAKTDPRIVTALIQMLRKRREDPHP